MPGQIPLSPRYYPSDFTVMVETFNIASAGTTTLPIFYVDRDIIIDSATIYQQGGVTLTNALTVKLKQMSDASVPTYATESQDIGSFGPITSGAKTAAIVPLTFVGGSTPTSNFVKAGSMIWIQGTSAPGAALNMPMTLRFRSQV